MSEHCPEPASRFVIAQSWWIASELARRNDLEVYELHPGGGMYDVLAVLRFNDSGHSSERLEMNRVGSLHVMADGASPMTWRDVLAADNPHTVVRRVEHELGLKPPHQPATTRRALTYRVISNILTSLIDERHPWDARMGFLDTSDYPGEGSRFSIDDRFPLAVEHARAMWASTSWGEANRHLWVLGSNLYPAGSHAHPVAVLSHDARLFEPGDTPPVDLMKLYNANNRRLSATVHAGLARLLP